MKKKPTQLQVKRKGLLAFAILAAPALLWAQVSLYSFTESVGTYTEITAADGGYSMGTPTYWPLFSNYRAFVDPNYPDGASTGGYLSPAIGPGYPIGFDLTYNGQVFDRLSVSNTGLVTFGKSSDGYQAVWNYHVSYGAGFPFAQTYGGPSVPYKRNRVAGWANEGLQMQDMSSQDPPGPLSSIRLATLGTAPNRVSVVQFKDMRGSYDGTSSLVNFQIRLNEADNSVEVRFGTITFGFQPGGGTQIGLGGSVPEDFNSRMTVYEEPAFLYDWNTTVPGVTNTDVCVAATQQFGNPNGSGIPPVLGRNWKWTPSVCPPPSWPLAIDDISFDAASAHWQGNASGEYEYYVSNTNSVTGPEISSGTTSDTSASFFGLEAATTYYVFVRSICGGVPGVWSVGTSFDTFRGGVVVCDGGVVTEDYCSHTYDVITWVYSSADLSPLKIEFLAGFIGSAGNESFRVWDGPPVGDSTVFTGDLTGNAFLAFSGQITIRLTTDAGACEAQPWYLPLQWRVGCKNCTDPLVNFNLGTMDCANQEYYVDVDVFQMGSATTLSLNNDLGLPPTIVSAAGVQTVGPFPAGQSVVITAQNQDNLLCYSASPATINEPCAIQDCGPTNYTYCYADNQYHQWAFQGEADQEIGMRFLEGSMGFGDVGIVYNSLDPFNALEQTNLPGFGSLQNNLYTSGTPSTDHALVMELTSDNSMSCMDADPLYGTSESWKWVVACYDGCTQPQATFASTCLSTTQFNVVVTITDIGNTGSVTISNDAGVAATTATAVGDYTVGPFTTGTPVVLNVEGASILCTWTSPKMAPDCSVFGISELHAQELRLYPNPSTGEFTLQLPLGMEGIADLRILDLSGRTVEEKQLNTAGRIAVDLSELPNGLYTAILRNNEVTAKGKISIQH